MFLKPRSPMTLSALLALQVVAACSNVPQTKNNRTTQSASDQAGSGSGSATGTVHGGGASDVGKLGGSQVSMALTVPGKVEQLEKSQAQRSGSVPDLDDATSQSAAAPERAHYLHPRCERDDNANFGILLLTLLEQDQIMPVQGMPVMGMPVMRIPPMPIGPGQSNRPMPMDPNNTTTPELVGTGVNNDPVPLPIAVPVGAGGGGSRPIAGTTLTDNSGSATVIDAPMSNDPSVALPPQVMPIDPVGPALPTPGYHMIERVIMPVHCAGGNVAVDLGSLAAGPQYSVAVRVYGNGNHGQRRGHGLLVYAGTSAPFQISGAGPTSDVVVNMSEVTGSQVHVQIIFPGEEPPPPVPVVSSPPDSPVGTSPPDSPVGTSPPDSPLSDPIPPPPPPPPPTCGLDVQSLQTLLQIDRQTQMQQICTQDSDCFYASVSNPQDFCHMQEQIIFSHSAGGDAKQQSLKDAAAKITAECPPQTNDPRGIACPMFVRYYPPLGCDQKLKMCVPNLLDRAPPPRPLDRPMQSAPIP